MRRSSCPDCLPEINRRDFVQQLGAAAFAAGTVSLAPLLPRALAAPTRSSQAETVVQKLHETLSAEQRKIICLPFNHVSRTKINANWHITQHTIGSDFYTKEQQALAHEIFRGLTSEEGHKQFMKHMEFDDGGLQAYSMALFGDPKSGQFEWVLTGRHATIRADGDSVAGAAFGGPIVYGHGEEDIKDNVFYYQTLKANEVFKALDPKQAERALITQAPPTETAVELQGTTGKFPGLKVADLTADQKKLVESVVKVLLAPYREEDGKEAMELIQKAGGMDALSMAFYKQQDLNNDSIWDIWRIEGPTFVSHFRGAPHVHAYLNIGMKA